MLWAIVSKTVVVHTVTYFLIGLIAFRVFNYAAMMSDPERAGLMRPATHPLVRAAVLFQPIRGVLFGVVFFLLRDALFGQPAGWAVLYVVLVVVGIVSTFAPAPGSIEGLIYNKPLQRPIRGAWLEALIQPLALSVLLFLWVNHPEAAWLTWILGIAFAVTIALGVMGLLLGDRTRAQTKAEPPALA